MPDYTLSAKITGDSSGFDKAIQNAEKSASNFEKQMESISKKAKGIGDKISGIGTKLTAGVTTPLALASKSMVDAASDFDENLNKIDVAFGNSASEVKAWADTATESFGLSMNQALEATSLFGDMATSMGISQGEAASMSTSLAGLAGDLASFKNIGIDQAMTALNGVFTGETESLKQLGIVMTEVNLQEFADGIGLVYDDMTQAEKVQLRYNYVMEMSKNAIGDYARTSDGTANSMRTFQASVENLATTLGQNLLPIVTPIIQKATEMVNTFAEADPELQQLVLKIAGIAAAAGPVLIVLGKLVSSFGIVTGAVGSMTKAISGIKNIGGIFSAITSPVGLAVAAITALVAAFAYLMTTNEEFRTSVMNTLSVIGESLMPILQTIGQLLTSIGSILVNVLAGALIQLAPILTQMVTFIGSLVQIVAPLVNMLIQSLVPVITQIITSVSNIVSAIIPPLIDILSAVMDAIESILPPIQSILEAAIEAISSIINAIGPIVRIVGECVSGIMVIVSPIVSFIGDIISGIMTIVSPIVSFIGDIISEIMSVVNPIVNFFSKIFGSIFSTVSDIFNNIYSVVSGVFTGIQNSWSGLTSFVGGVVDGISGAFNTLVSTVKSVINGVIKGINGAIGVINLIPGVNIGKISYLLHGTDNWQGGFAYMNEGGRGELTYLPNGAQVIPHDISVQYAKEAARANRGVESIDLTGVLEGVTIQVYSQTNVDGTPLKEMAADYTIQKIGREQRAFNRSRGISYA